MFYKSLPLCWPLFWFGLKESSVYWKFWLKCPIDTSNSTGPRDNLSSFTLNLFFFCYCLLTWMTPSSDWSSNQIEESSLTSFFHHPSTQTSTLANFASPFFFFFTLSNVRYLVQVISSISSLNYRDILLHSILVPLKSIHYPYSWSKWNSKVELLCLKAINGSLWSPRAHPGSRFVQFIHSLSTNLMPTIWFR